VLSDTVNEHVYTVNKRVSIWEATGVNSKELRSEIMNLTLPRHRRKYNRDARLIFTNVISIRLRNILRAVTHWLNSPVGTRLSKMFIIMLIHSHHIAFSALTLLVGRQEGHPVCKKNWVVGCWHGYVSRVRRRLAYGPIRLAYGPADWFYLSGTGSPG